MNRQAFILELHVSAQMRPSSRLAKVPSEKSKQRESGKILADRHNVAFSLGDFLLRKRRARRLFACESAKFSDLETQVRSAVISNSQATFRGGVVSRSGLRGNAKKKDRASECSIPHRAALGITSWL